MRATKRYRKYTVRNTIRTWARKGQVELRPAVATRNLAGDCADPVSVSMRGSDPVGPRETGPAIWADGLYRCRKCEPCLRRRGREWTSRAMTEVARAPRTWLVTLTLRPEAHFMLGLRSTRRLRGGGTDLDALSPNERFNERWREIGVEATKWLKRTRERSGALRYLMVVEAHKSGLPHIHLLVHDVDGASVLYRHLVDHWPHGFAHAKLVEDARSASYVCKYLSKSALARVRASSGYGT